MKAKHSLRDRVVSAAQAALAQQRYVGGLDVLVGIRWLPESSVKLWKQGRIPYLLSCIQTDPSKVSDAMEIFRAWATDHQLHPSEANYASKTPARASLRFAEDSSLDLA